MTNENAAQAARRAKSSERTGKWLGKYATVSKISSWFIIAGAALSTSFVGLAAGAIGLWSSRVAKGSAQAATGRGRRRHQEAAIHRRAATTPRSAQSQTQQPSQEQQTAPQAEPQHAAADVAADNATRRSRSRPRPHITPAHAEPSSTPVEQPKARARQIGHGLSD